MESMQDCRTQIASQAFARATNRVHLGEFLRTRRARLSPADFGLPPFGRRRTPGLRREEVAQLAGISIAYYTWIEQGRDLNMSPDVLRSLARVLRFTHAERTHLFTLAGTPLPEHDLAANAELHRTLAHLFSDSRNVCAFARDPWFNVTAATSLATSVFGVRPGRGLESNLLYRIFDDPLQQQLWVDWESEVRCASACCGKRSRSGPPGRKVRNSSRYSSAFLASHRSGMATTCVRIRRPTRFPRGAVGTRAPEVRYAARSPHRDDDSR